MKGNIKLEDASMFTRNPHIWHVVISFINQEWNKKRNSLVYKSGSQKSSKTFIYCYCYGLNNILITPMPDSNLHATSLRPRDFDLQRYLND